jgi:hypothetical protein
MRTTGCAGSITLHKLPVVLQSGAARRRGSSFHQKAQHRPEADFTTLPGGLLAQSVSASRLEFGELGGQLVTCPHPEFLEDSVRVQFDGALGDVQLLPNVFVAMTENDKGCNLALPIRQDCEATVRV